MTTNETPRIYIADLAAYNEGLLEGEWLELPQDDIMEAVEVILARTSANRLALHLNETNDQHSETFYPSEEWAIHDYENLEFYGSVSEYEGLETLNSACEAYLNLNDQDQKKLSFLMDCQGYTLNQALDQLDDCQIYEDIDFDDLAEEFVNEGLFGDIPSHLANYIDYSAIARDLQYDYTEYSGDIFRCD